MAYRESGPVVLFDLYQTVVDIETDESSDEFWQDIEDHLTQYDNKLKSYDLKELYLELCKQIKSDTLKGQSVLEVLFPRYFRIVTGQAANLGQLYGFIAMFRRRSHKTLEIRKYVLPLLDKLTRKGYSYGLVSNTEAIFTKIDLEDLGLAGKFKSVVLSSDVGAEKPDPAPFLAAIRSLGAVPDRTVHIGDNFDADIVGAENAGIKSILLHDRPSEFDGRLPSSCLGIIPTNGRGLYKKISLIK